MAEKNLHAVALGILGGSKGGKARAESLSPERRKEIATKAANARWAADMRESRRRVARKQIELEMEPILLACPFCHNNDFVFENGLGEDGEVAIHCNICFVLGPIGIGKNEAILKWNGQLG
jgi:hypothetical protein